MIVAMVSMRVMQSAVYEIVDVVPMRNRLVAAAGTVLMAFTAMLWGAADWVLLADLNHMLIDVPFARMEQVAVL